MMMYLYYTICNYISKRIIDKLILNLDDGKIFQKCQHRRYNNLYCKLIGKDMNKNYYLAIMTDEYIRGSNFYNISILTKEDFEKEYIINEENS